MLTAKPNDRHALITGAVLSIAAEQGLGSATLRSVARTADVSMGMVQHHFASTEILHHDALNSGLAAMRTRLDASTERAIREAEPQTVVKLIARAHLEDSDTVVELLRAISQFRAKAAHDETVASAIADYDAHYTSVISSALTLAGSRRLLHKLVDPQPEAPVFWALITALGTDVALGLRERADAKALIRYHFLRLARNTRVTRR